MPSQNWLDSFRKVFNKKTSANTNVDSRQYAEDSIWANTYYNRELGRQPMQWPMLYGPSGQEPIRWEVGSYDLNSQYYDPKKYVKSNKVRF